MKASVVAPPPPCPGLPCPGRSCPGCWLGSPPPGFGLPCPGFGWLGSPCPGFCCPPCPGLGWGSAPWYFLPLVHLPRNNWITATFDPVVLDVGVLHDDGHDIGPIGIGAPPPFIWVGPGVDRRGPSGGGRLSPRRPSAGGPSQRRHHRRRSHRSGRKLLLEVVHHFDDASGVADRLDHHLDQFEGELHDHRRRQNPGLQQPLSALHDALHRHQDLGVALLLDRLVDADGAVGLDVDGAGPLKIVPQDGLDGGA